MEGDPCKFALWLGRTPTSDNKIVLKVWFKFQIDTLSKVLFHYSCHLFLASYKCFICFQVYFFIQTLLTGSAYKHVSLLKTCPWSQIKWILPLGLCYKIKSIIHLRILEIDLMSGCFQVLNFQVLWLWLESFHCIKSFGKTCKHFK